MNRSYFITMEAKSDSLYSLVTAATCKRIRERFDEDKFKEI